MYLWPILVGFIYGCTSSYAFNASELNLGLLGAPLTRETRALDEKWMEVAEEYARSHMRRERAVNRQWAPRPFRLDLPTDTIEEAYSTSGRSSRGSTLPILVVPVPYGDCGRRYSYQDDYDDDSSEERPVRKHKKKKGRKPPRVEDYSGEEEEDLPPQYSPLATKRPLPPRPNDLEEFTVVVPESSASLVRIFREQSPSNPELPPAVLPTSEPPLQVPPLTRSTVEVANPQPPQWRRSLYLRAELTAIRGGYSEPYTVWWDAATGQSRAEFHGGSTTTITSRLPDGRYQRVEVRKDGQTGETQCAIALARHMNREDLATPGLPDLSQFQFVEYADVGGAKVDVWRRHVQGTEGAGPNEVLSYTHEMLLIRDVHGDAIPVRYSVAVNSSMLGSNCDGYEHRYAIAEHMEPPPHAFALPSAHDCSSTESLDDRRSVHKARLLPLREFTLPQRDVRYDELFNGFTEEFNRTFIDDAESAVRKNTYMQHSRFMLSGNRQGGPFAMGPNFLADRLDKELDVLMGVREDSEGIAAEMFPHGNAMQEASRLPEAFDWRDKGGVTKVRNQGSCSSCWAMAVTGAVEGALFKATGKLVELAEQALVDCAHEFGTHGCRGSWPSQAYDYIQQRGIPAIADYGEHKAKVESCRAPRPVKPETYISAHVNVTAQNIEALQIAIKEHAPTVVIIDSHPKSFIFYKNGVLRDDRCNKKAGNGKLNHAVLATGYGVENGEKFFNLKNSWSEAWGDKGYIKVHAPSNTCGHQTLPSYPRLEKEDASKAKRG